jgi:hypothetical protein
VIAIMPITRSIRKIQETASLAFTSIPYLCVVFAV